MNKFRRTFFVSFFVTVFVIFSLIGFYISYKNLKINPQTSDVVVVAGNSSDGTMQIRGNGFDYQLDLSFIKKVETIKNEYFYLIPPSLRIVEKLLYLL